MDIQSEAQAAKVRAVMGAMISRLQEARAAGDKDRVTELKAQYTTLQVALQEYKAQSAEVEAADPDPATNPAPGTQDPQAPQPATPAERAAARTAKLKEEISALKGEVRSLRVELSQAQKTVDAQRSEIGALKWEKASMEDELRSLRNPPPAQAYKQVQTIPLPTPAISWENPTVDDLMAEFTREYPAKSGKNT